MNDRRTTKSKDAIRTCFLSLLKEKKLNKITVAEICRMADIGRAPFTCTTQTYTTCTARSRMSCAKACTSSLNPAI